jgi:hypothetical protein
LIEGTIPENIVKDGGDIDIVLIADANFASGMDISQYPALDGPLYGGSSEIDCLVPGEGSSNNTIVLHNLLDWTVLSNGTNKQTDNKILLDYSRSVLDSNFYPGITGADFASGIIASTWVGATRFGRLEPGDRLDTVSGGLGGFKTIVTILPFASYSCAEMEALRFFINQGGRLIVIYDGEEYNSLKYGRAQFVVNNLLSALGSNLAVSGGNVGGPEGTDAAYSAQSPVNSFVGTLCASVGGPLNATSGNSNSPAAKYNNIGIDEDLIVAGNTGRFISLVPGYCDVPYPATCFDDDVDVVVIGDANFISGTQKYTGNATTIPNCLLENANNVNFLREVIDWDVGGNCTQRSGKKFLIDVSRSVFDSNASEFTNLTGQEFAEGIISGLTTGGASDPWAGRFDILGNGTVVSDNMDEYKTVIMVLPYSAYSCKELEHLLYFVNTGGLLIVVFEGEPAFGSAGGSTPGYSGYMNGLPVQIVNDVLGAVGSPLRVGAGFESGYAASTTGAFLDSPTPINQNVYDATMCHGVGAPLFTFNQIGQFDVVEYSGQGNPAVVVAGYTDHPDTPPSQFCS